MTWRNIEEMQMSRLGIGMAAAAAMLVGAGYAEPSRVPEPRPPKIRERHPYYSTRRGHCFGTPMILGGKLAKRLKRGKLLFSQ